MKLLKLPTHVIQSSAWGKFKEVMGVSVIRVNGVSLFLHKIPFTNFNLAYCPKVNPEELDFEAIRRKSLEHNCLAVRFDVPNLIYGSPLAKSREKNFKKHCQLAPRSTFAQYTILLDLTQSEEEILRKMHPKARYNIRLAKRKGIIVKEKNDIETLERFLVLQKQTAARQKFYLHSDKYYRTLWQVLQSKKMIHLLEASYQGEPLVIWVLLEFRKVLYYPYGGSSEIYQNFMPSNLLGWEAIRLGKRLGCRIFDMWGASNSQDRNDPWYGFTHFKLGYGGNLVRFIDSYDLVLNPLAYYLFNFGYSLAWKVLRFKKSIL